MPSQLETAANPDQLRRVVIEPVTRVEGHGKVTLLLDADDRVQQARLHIVEFRGFEKFIQGRPFWELPVLVQRLCGICPVSHHLAAAKACDQLVGVDRLTPTAEKVRRLMHFGQVLQSHALHFFHLSSPDLLFGFDDAVAHRNIVGMIQDHPDIARQGVLLRKYGQEVIRVTCGKRIHGTGALPGGVNKSVDAAERDLLRADIGQIVAWAVDAVALIRRIFLADVEQNSSFGTVDANSLSLVRADGGLELYDGSLRARDATGETIFDHASCDDYAALLREQVKPWTYMKFPFIQSLGPDAGWYRVGPLARVNNCDYIDTPLAEHERIVFADGGGGTSGAIGAGDALGTNDRAAALRRVHPAVARRPGHRRRRSAARGRAPADRHRRHRGPARHLVPSLRDRRRRSGAQGQPDRLHHQQQSGHERVDPSGRAHLSGWPPAHGAAVEPDRGRDPRLRSLSVLRHPRGRQDAAGDRAARCGRDACRPHPQACQRRRRVLLWRSRWTPTPSQ